MKLSPLAIGLAALTATCAQAQSSVTLFGIVDVNFARFSGEGNGSQRVLGTDGYASSRIGFRGTEDLGGGVSANFWLEAAISPDDGRAGGGTNTNNQVSGAVAAGPLTFGRRATVGLSGNWGEVRLGRDYVPGFWNLSAFSPFGTNGVGSSAFLFYPVQAGARITNVRASNSVGYHLPQLGGFYGQVMYALGENASNAGATKDDGDVTGLRVGYKVAGFDGAVANTKTRISALGDLRQRNVGVSYDFKIAKAMALWNENRVGGTRTRSALVGGTATLGAGLIRAAYSRVKTDGIANDADQWALGYVHNLSKRTALYTNWSRINNKEGGTNYNVGRATTTPGGRASGYELGVRHTF